jgi:hypothetical protein
MLNTWYTQFSGYFWMVGLAILTYLVMCMVRKLFATFTKGIKNQKDRRFINLIFGVVMCIAISFGLGRVGNLLFGTNVFFMWFVGGGLLAHYSNLVWRKYRDADSAAFAAAFIEAMRESNFDISEDDLELLTTEVKDIVKAFADNNAKSRKNKIRGVASGITGSVEITDDEQKELERHINALKSAGFDTASLDALYAKAKADGKVTVAEADNLKAVIRAIHNATNI